LKSFVALVWVSTMAVGYVLINVAPGKEHEVYLAVKDMAHVADATLLFGDHDLSSSLKQKVWPPSQNPLSKPSAKFPVLLIRKPSPVLNSDCTSNLSSICTRLESLYCVLTCQNMLSEWGTAVPIWRSVAFNRVKYYILSRLQT